MSKLHFFNHKCTFYSAYKVNLFLEYVWHVLLTFSCSCSSSNFNTYSLPVLDDLKVLTFLSNKNKIVRDFFKINILSSQTELRIVFVIPQVSDFLFFSTLVSCSSQSKCLTFEWLCSASLSCCLIPKCHLTYERKFGKLQFVHERCIADHSAILCPPFFFSSPGVVTGTAGLALQDWRGLGWAGRLALESRRTSHSQHLGVPRKCEGGLCTCACIHARWSVFMRMLVWFQLLLARKEGRPENSQTPEPFLTACTSPLLLHVFSLISFLPSC